MMMLVGGIALIAVAVGGLLFYLNRDNGVLGDNNRSVACTMEAKLCPDGSYVGRAGPSCEFKACPGETNTTPKVQTNINIDTQGRDIKY